MSTDLESLAIELRSSQRAERLTIITIHPPRERLESEQRRIPSDEHHRPISLPMHLLLGPFLRVHPGCITYLSLVVPVRQGKLAQLFVCGESIPQGPGGRVGKRCHLCQVGPSGLGDGGSEDGGVWLCLRVGEGRGEGGREGRGGGI